MKKLLLYIILAGTSLACTNKEVENPEHEHDHGGVKLLFTEYTDQYEIFAEADLFVKGEATTILAHFTQLSNFKPVKASSIKASLIMGESKLEQTIEKSIRPGIYSFSFTPEKNGAGKLVFELSTENGKHEIGIENIVVYGDEHTAALIAEKKQISNANAIAFTKEQSWKINFETAWPKEQTFGPILKTTAQVSSDNTNETIISSKTNGIVVFHKNILEGNMLSVGEKVLNISANGLANENAGVKFSEAQNNYEQTKASYDRNKALSQNNIVSGKEVESSKREFENAKAIYENLKKNFNEKGQVVSASSTGVIKQVFVVNGQYVEAGEKLLALASNEKLLVKAEVQQKHFASLKSIVSATIKSTIDNKMYDLDELKGKFISYGQNIDQADGYLIPVYFQIENNNKFLAGSFVEMYIKTNVNSKALTVPNSALIEEQGNFFVFVQVTPELFERREVIINESDGIYTEILSGINAQDRIVSKGAIIVKLAAVSNSLDPHAGHVH